MKLPSLELRVIDWPEEAMDNWQLLTERLKTMAVAAGKNDLFHDTSMHLKQLSLNMKAEVFVDLIRTRVAARAITQLWLEDADFCSRMLNSYILDVLINEQSGHLGMIPLYNLISLYFRKFDELDEQEIDLREGFETLLKTQLEMRFFVKKNHISHQRDLTSVLYSEASWLLSIDGPKCLVRYVKEAGCELDKAFSHFELRGLDTGRYASICRAHYYLEILKSLPIGQYHIIFSELLKPTVSHAPYDAGKRFGHVILEILIDRSGDISGDEWQNFIMDLAGDPRISGNVQSYREWWKPLGEERIDKVRRWLYKEDLKLFLSALEQYGQDSGDAAMQRMFPARKKFVEGLDKLKLVRKTRLMLGTKAAYAVKRILGNDVKTSFVHLDDMSDKAVIYIDCGEFCLIEGSHSFKLWVYLKPPWESLYSYDSNNLSHFSLTTQTRSKYKEIYGLDAPYTEITHSASTWHNRFFNFLAKHGININIEPLMFSDDYKVYVNRFGMPYVEPVKTRVEPLLKPS